MMRYRANIQTMTVDELSIWTIRFLAVDMVEKAQSGHPGMPLGAAPMAHILWHRFLRVNPSDSRWFNRDRFVLSAGHGSALLYALLHLSGFPLTLDDLQKFRQWGSKTPGHPERSITEGVEATTGPLGQGFANAVGMALAEKHLAAVFNREGFNIIDHFTYVIASDGDLMEGISSEAASLAGHWKLDKLIVLYDDNRITIDGRTDLAFTEDVLGRFAAYGWHVQRIGDGNDINAIETAIKTAQKTNKPSIISIRTIIGYGSPKKQDTAAAHGAPLGAEEVEMMKKLLNWPVESFWIPKEVYKHYQVVQDRGHHCQQEWEIAFHRYSEKYPELAEELIRRIQGELPQNWNDLLSDFPANGKIATRKASGKILNKIAQKVPEIIGGSADLTESNNVKMEQTLAFSVDHREGRQIYFGVREHAMGGIINGIAYHGGLRPFGATFLVFSDYMRPSIRIAAMERLPVIYIFTHDSIGLGEDGPTHQPIEHLVSLRAIPNLYVFRPADANETRYCWEEIMRLSQPAALVLTRQDVPILSLEKYPQIPDGVRNGGYILKDSKAVPSLIIVASGSEVHPAIEAAEILMESGMDIRVVSMPCIELFLQQSNEYRERILPLGIPTITIEAGATLGWRTYFDKSDNHIGIDHFGASAPGNILMEKFGFTAQHIAETIRKWYQSHLASFA